MAKVLRWGAAAAGLAVLLVLAVGFYFYRAVTALPEEYVEVLQTNPEQLEQARQSLESNLAALYSDSQQAPATTPPTGWQTQVTQDQVNGWLATRLDEELPEVRSNGVEAPRVLFDTDQVTLGFQLHSGKLAAVVLLRVAPFVLENGRLAVEVLEARIGSAKLPVGRIVEASRPLLQQADAPLEWMEDQGRSVLVVNFEELASDSGRRRTLEAVRVEQGRLLATGHSTPTFPRVASRETVESETGG